MITMKQMFLIIIVSFLNDLNYLIIKYKDLVNSSVQTMTTICKFLDINFNQVLLTPTRFGRNWSGNSMFGDNQKAIHNKGIGRYKENLEIKSIQLIESYLHTELKVLGYNLNYPESNYRKLPYLTLINEGIDEIIKKLKSL